MTTVPKLNTFPLAGIFIISKENIFEESSILFLGILQNPKNRAFMIILYCIIEYYSVLCCIKREFSLFYPPVNFEESDNEAGYIDLLFF